ncbi:MAG: hypothetical protein QXP53_00600 [Candidatus Pacearchaeota archaeon]
MQEDMFNEIIMCSKCKKRMTPIHVVKNGFKIRTLECSRCGKRVYHPVDVEEYKKFVQLRQRPFEVKLRVVGNSYAVSIPKEIIDFIQEQEYLHEKIKERMDREMKNMQKMVKMFLESSGKLSLFFGNNEEVKKEENKKINKSKIEIEENESES